MRKNYNYQSLLYFKKLLSIAKKYNFNYSSILNSLQVSDNFSLKYINYLKHNNFINFFFYRILNIFKLIIYKNLSHTNIPKIKNFKSIQLTWGFRRNFDNKGNFKDNYLNINSNNKKCLILILYLDNILPQNINSNCILLFHSRNRFKSVIKNIIKIIFNIFTKKNFSQTYQSFLGENLSYLIKEIFKDLKFNNFIIPYEGSLSQKIIVKNIRENFKNQKIIGIVHSLPQPLPINFIYNKLSSPDEIIVNGKNQKNIFVKYLGWNSRKIYIKKSYKYKKVSNFKSLLSNKIFLPYNLNNSKKIMESFVNIKYLLNRDMEICIHPLKKEDKKHILLKNNIKNELSDIKISKSNKGKNLSIFLDATSGLFLAVEKNIKVIQICSDQNLYYYNPNIWKGLRSKKLYDNIFEYYKYNKKSLIEF